MQPMPNTCRTPELWTSTISYTIPSVFCRTSRMCSHIIRKNSDTSSSTSIRTRTICNISLPRSWRAAAGTSALSATTTRASINSAARRSRISSPLKSSTRTHVSSGSNRITARPATFSPRRTPSSQTTASARAKRSGRRSPAATPSRSSRRGMRMTRPILSRVPSPPRAGPCVISPCSTGRTRSRAASSLRSSAAPSRTAFSAARASLTAPRSRIFWHISA